MVARSRVGAVPALLLAAMAPVLLGAVDMRTGFAQRLLAAHNRERMARAVPPLAWNPLLARDASVWANHLAEIGRLVHSPDEPLDPDPEGENLWAGSRGYYAPEAMVGLWAAERRYYKPGLFPRNSITGRLEQVGHYTQLMWRSSRMVGCAIARGRRDDFLVCRYSEGGNVIGERPF